MRPDADRSTSVIGGSPPVAKPLADGVGAGALPRAASRVTLALQPIALHRRRAKRAGVSPSNVTRGRDLIRATTGTSSADPLSVPIDSGTYRRAWTPGGPPR
jgi:hypothetical protein